MNRKVYWGLASIIMACFISFFVFYSFYVAAEPVVETVEALVNEDEATLSGMVKDSGGKEITQYGFNWGMNSSLEEKETVSGGGSVKSDFFITISALQEGITYYYQAYAENSKGYGYGEIKSFTVPVNLPPEVSISSPEDNLSVISEQAVSISATAADDKQVESMEVYINDTSAYQTDSESLTYEFDTSTVNPGEYAVKVTAWDGKKYGEQFITLIVEEKLETADSNPPVVRDNNDDSTSVSRAADPTPSYEYPKLSVVQGSYGQFRYKDTSGGRIEIAPRWVAENIVTITLPGLNVNVPVHKDAADNFIQAFTYIANGSAVINGRDVPLINLINTMDGTFVSRHVNWNPAKGLSHHSWGIAMDINAADHFRYVNPSSEPNDPNLILWEKAFKPAGFSWGNSYSDAMHFELLN